MSKKHISSSERNTFIGRGVPGALSFEQVDDILKKSSPDFKGSAEDPAVQEQLAFLVRTLRKEDPFSTEINFSFSIGLGMQMSVLKRAMSGKLHFSELPDVSSSIFRRIGPGKINEIIAALKNQGRDTSSLELYITRVFPVQIDTNSDNQDSAKNR